MLHQVPAKMTKWYYS